MEFEKNNEKKKRTLMTKANKKILKRSKNNSKIK
jgi:hypothetical protein